MQHVALPPFGEAGTRQPTMIRKIPVRLKKLKRTSFHRLSKSQLWKGPNPGPTQAPLAVGSG